MNSAIEQMLKSYHVENIYDRKNAMKEIMQEIVLAVMPVILFPSADRRGRIT